MIRMVRTYIDNNNRAARKLPVVRAARLLSQFRMIIIIFGVFVAEGDIA